MEVFQESKITRITNKLYLSSYIDSLKYAELVNLGVQQILTIGPAMPHTSEYFDSRTQKKVQFALKCIPIDDHADVNIKQYFPEIFAFINAGVTLVHCVMGISRSATAVIAYLIHGGMHIDTAFKYVKDRRPIINPNYGFIGQLIEFSKERDLYDEKFIFVEHGDYDFDFNVWEMVDFKIKA